jgi:hypothetical protein
MKFLGVDTASDRKDRGYAIVEDGAIIWSGSEPPPWGAGPIDFVVGERPWQKKKASPERRGRGLVRDDSPGLTGENLITFCVNNGFQLRDAWPFAGAQFLLLPVSTWKDLALPGCAGYPGDVFCRNFGQKYAPKEGNHNCLDAMGIALAGSRIPPDQRKKFTPKGFLR